MKSKKKASAASVYARRGEDGVEKGNKYPGEKGLGEGGRPAGSAMALGKPEGHRG